MRAFVRGGDHERRAGRPWAVRVAMRGDLKGR